MKRQAPGITMNWASLIPLLIFAAGLLAASGQTNAVKPIVKLNLSSPDEALRSIHRAYLSNDLAGATACVDFRAMAAYRNRDKRVRPTAERLEEEAARHAKRWMEVLSKEGLPDYKEVVITEIKKPTLQPGGYYLLCFYFGAGKRGYGRQFATLVKTPAGWKFVLPPGRLFSSDDKPFPYPE